MKNEINSNLLIGGFYYPNGDLTQPGVFSLEITPDGTIVQKNTCLLPLRENTKQKIYFDHTIPAIYRNTDNTTDFYILNLVTSDLSHLVSDSKNNVITDQQIRIKNINTNTRITPNPAYGLTINSTGMPFMLVNRQVQQKIHSRLKIIRDKDVIFAVQINKDPETKKDGIYVTKFNTRLGDCVDYKLFEDYRLADGQVMKQFSLDRLIQTGKNTFNMEAYFGKRMDALVKIKLN